MSRHLEIFAGQNILGELARIQDIVEQAKSDTEEFPDELSEVERLLRILSITERRLARTDPSTIPVAVMNKIAAHLDKTSSSRIDDQGSARAISERGG